jgi:hypothetical protein
MKTSSSSASWLHRSNGGSVAPLQPPSTKPSIGAPLLGCIFFLDMANDDARKLSTERQLKQLAAVRFAHHHAPPLLINASWMDVELSIRFYAKCFLGRNKYSNFHAKVLPTSCLPKALPPFCGPGGCAVSPRAVLLCTRVRACVRVVGL